MCLRYYAWEYGQQIQPRHGNFVELFDSLAACNYTRPSPKKQLPPRFTTRVGADCAYYVDADNGSDSNDGSVSAPFQSILKAVEATRKDKARTTACTVNLMEGTYYQGDTITLTAAGSLLTFQNYAGQRATISGGVAIEFSGEWKLESYRETQWTNYSNWNNVFGIASQDSSNDQAKLRSTPTIAHDHPCARTDTSPCSRRMKSAWRGADVEHEPLLLCDVAQPGLRRGVPRPLLQREGRALGPLYRRTTCFLGHLEGCNIW